MTPAYPSTTRAAVAAGLLLALALAGCSDLPRGQPAHGSGQQPASEGGVTVFGTVDVNVGAQRSR
ncbi:hypothetical protein SAMN05428957_102322 [Oryzisolibacter propanilivorax]|uniref:Uncharacterized protein n=1 Tax=Oryzisolibacter propanilivorax TaxID=1527607 RepID=A0A1G9QH94_9BURK|nr:hypothetical protein [Oryzisolibacter propanilivorax]SDM10408.1 hypothetical protein SAMN05428957_102322 [Oryzisolibacter propanilivorax]